MKHAVGFQQIWVPFKARLFLAVYYQVVFVCMMMESFGYFWQRDDRSRLGGDATAYDFLDGQAAASQQDACFFQFQPLDKLGKVLAGALYQQPGHLSVAVGEMLGQLVQGQVFAVVLQVVQYGNDGRIGAGVFGFCTVGMASQQENEAGGHQAVKHLAIV